MRNKRRASTTLTLATASYFYFRSPWLGCFNIVVPVVVVCVVVDVFFIFRSMLEMFFFPSIREFRVLILWIFDIQMKWRIRDTSNNTEALELADGMCLVRGTFMMISGRSLSLFHSNSTCLSFSLLLANFSLSLTSLLIFLSLTHHIDLILSNFLLLTPSISLLLCLSFSPSLSLSRIQP